jgi:hypothetical protein
MAVSNHTENNSSYTVIPPPPPPEGLTPQKVAAGIAILGALALLAGYFFDANTLLFTGMGITVAGVLAFLGQIRSSDAVVACPDFSGGARIPLPPDGFHPCPQRFQPGVSRVHFYLETASGEVEKVSELVPNEFCLVSLHPMASEEVTSEEVIQDPATGFEIQINAY